jgi:ABC-type phosphate/phosphonate transport system substrate-binding protein
MTQKAPAQSAHTLHGGFDANLDFPMLDSYWAPLLKSGRCQIASFTDMEPLTQGLLAHLIDFAYLPSANCYFLRHDPMLQGIASACSPRTGKPVQSSVFVVKKSNPATSWHDLRGKRLGYINTFCTTSYFSPSILLAREGLQLNAFFDAFAVPAWQGQIDAVIAGRIDATMVYEDVWLANPKNAVETKIIDRLDGLPTPPFIARTDVDPAFVTTLKSELLAYKPHPTPSTLYAGFADYQSDAMQRFFAELETIPGMAAR